LFNASAFYYDYRNIQVNIQTNQGGVLRTILQNAANAESYGFDAEARIPLSPAFELRGGFAWTHATYSSFSDALLTFPVTDPAGVPIGGNTQGPGDASGNDMIRSPDITANLAGTFTTALMGGELQLTATGSYNDGWYWDPGNTVKEDAFFLLNSRASWKDASRRFELFAYGENLTSAKFCLYANNTTTGNGCAPARPWRAGVGFNVFF
jgi:iron complex outermembrane receptor protein